MDHPVEPTNYKVFDCLVNKTWFFLPHFGRPFIVSLGCALFAQSCLQMVAISSNGRRGYLRAVTHLVPNSYGPRTFGPPQLVPN